MSHPDYTKLKGITQINKDFVSNNLFYGLIDFYNWSFLEIGGFQNITRNPPTSGIYGGDKSRLHPIDDPRYSDGCVWEGFRTNWVWETGLDYSVQPIRVSGVWVDNTFYNLNTSGTYSHYVDYPNGRIIFNTPITTTKRVEASFSPRYAQFISYEEPILKNLLFDSHRVERGDYLTFGSGNWSMLGDEKVQFPVIGIEPSKYIRLSPYQIGGGQYWYQDILFYIITDNPIDKRNLVDIFISQNDRTIFLPSRAAIKESSNYPLSLNYQGSPVPSALQYPDLVSESGYRWGSVYFSNTNMQELEIPNPNLYGAVVRTTVQLILENI